MGGGGRRGQSLSRLRPRPLRVSSPGTSHVGCEQPRTKAVRKAWKPVGKRSRGFWQQLGFPFLLPPPPIPGILISLPKMWNALLSSPQTEVWSQEWTRPGRVKRRPAPPSLRILSLRAWLLRSRLSADPGWASTQDEGVTCGRELCVQVCRCYTCSNDPGSLLRPFGE